MASQAFTKNYRDHSNDQGFQFEFFCDKCGNGFRSTFKGNNLGVAASLLHAAGSIFGGIVKDAAWGADHAKDAFRGGAWDEAFKEAITECAPRFRQCTRCGQWVCPEICWNEKRVMCEDCAPDLQEEAAAMQAEVAVEQLRDKMREVDQTGGQNFTDPQAAACGRCNARLVPNAKFCSGCGAPTAAPKKAFCHQCGTEAPPGGRFCSGCGTKMG
ncbi:zinc ribbon domain-containing protein [Pendulispora brunnea]|uniref:Zinc ribbon domain-containing protein n=1 Tax=Pendulispora brunnea TaxID=2905690 RepID=A0ABZ2KEX7_9BACT